MAGFENEMRSVCEFIGLEWMAGMSDFGDRVQAREHATPSTAQLSQGLVTSATAQWRNYEAADPIGFAGARAMDEPVRLYLGPTEVAARA